MTTPVQNSSSYGPTAQLDSADACDPNLACCEAPPEAPAAQVITLEPIVIEADPGAQQLVKQFEALRSTPDCSPEAMQATLTCAKAGLTAAAVLNEPTARNIVLTVIEGVACGRDLRAYYDCRNP